MYQLVTIREPRAEDERNFIDTMQASSSVHYPWITAPSSTEEFQTYLQKYSNQERNKSFLVVSLDDRDKILGIINLNEIIGGCFQNAFLAYYATAAGVGSGALSRGLQLVIAHAFNQLSLHRLEANIQPENLKSVEFIKRNGFVCEGLAHDYLFIDGKWRDHWHFVLLNKNWS